MATDYSSIDPARAAATRRERLLGAVTLGAILLFVGTASSVLATVVQHQLVGQATIDRTLAIALILNVALILFGWRRHNELRRELLIRLAAEERARALATCDPLTGFLTRRALAEQGATMVARAQRRNKLVAIMIVDLDHFRVVNDMHGHDVGDVLLRQVASEISTILPQGALNARLGSDTFGAALLFDAAYPETVERCATRLVERLSQPFTVEGHHIQIGASIGIARSDQDGAAMDTMLRSADIAVTAAKKAGRNRHLWFDESMERELRARNELEAALRHAIPLQQIVPFFEQQIDLVTGRLIGFEVLARWDHPLRGLLEPDQFIRVAEETGLIGDLSLSVLRQAFLTARDWHAGLSLSVNIAPSQLKDPWLAQKIVKLLAETGFPAHRLEIEITETALFDNLSLAQSVTMSLKNQGMRIALDDFGTGYSSIAHLRAIAFDRIKVDHSFVTTINTNPESAAIVTAIARLAESLNLPITAEGIEDQAIEERVRALGFNRGQGYRFGRPMNAANARRVLAERRLLQPGMFVSTEPAAVERTDEGRAAG